MKYKIEIRETLRRVVEIEAPSEEEAIKEADRIVLDWDDCSVRECNMCRNCSDCMHLKNQECELNLCAFDESSCGDFKTIDKSVRCGNCGFFKHGICTNLMIINADVNENQSCPNFTKKEA